MRSHPKAETRARLLKAGQDLFYEKGYSATGLAELLERADANSGSFYHFFESKEALLNAVLERYVELLEPELLAPIYEQERDPIERVFALLAQYRAALIATKFGYACPIGRIALEVEPEMARVHERIARNFTAWSEAVRANLEAARDRFPGGYDLHRLSVFVLTVMEGAVMQARAHKSIEPFDASVAMLREHFSLLHGRATPPRR
jgi:TetR/AcrR family transcriptional regulator, transcriptional repressor for nem operon